MARLLAVWFPDWPVVAAGITEGFPVNEPSAVLRGNRVLACSGVARRRGVRRGMRYREAQSACPELRVAKHDPDRDARLFETAATEVEHRAPGIEVVRPGMVVVPVRGPASAFGGEQRAAERMVEHLGTELGLECLVGVAEGLFAAALAAKHGRIVPEGQCAQFLAPLPVAELANPVQAVHPKLESARAELVDLLPRMGIHTLGEFAALPERDVAGRFGGDAVGLHRLARGEQRRPAARRAVAPETRISMEFDPALDRIDTVAFAARGLAERFMTVLREHGLACVRIGVHASTERGESYSRTWRCVEPLTEHGVAERVRWQLEGWLRRAKDRPTSGVRTVELEPEETLSGAGMQLGLEQSTATANAERAARALVRLQGLLGPEAVHTAVLRGGRAPAERVRLVPWGEERCPDTDPGRPWPGKLPAPSPSSLPIEPAPVTVLDERSTPVGITARHELTGNPHLLRTGAGEPLRIHAWAGPWLASHRWWTEDAPRELARMQVFPADRLGLGYLLVRQERRWFIEGVYD